MAKGPHPKKRAVNKIGNSPNVHPIHYADKFKGCAQRHPANKAPGARGQLSLRRDAHLPSQAGLSDFPWWSECGRARKRL